MRISDIQISDLKAYANVYHNEDDELFGNILIASKMFVKSFTGLDDDSLDSCEDLSMAVFILSNDLYDNRSFNVDVRFVNQVVSAILNVHSVNLL